MEIVIDNSNKRKSALIVQAQRIDTDTHRCRYICRASRHSCGLHRFTHEIGSSVTVTELCHSCYTVLLSPTPYFSSTPPSLTTPPSPSLLSTAVDLRLSCAVNLILMRICCPPAPILTHAWDIAYIVPIHCQLLLIRKSFRWTYML